MFLNYRIQKLLAQNGDGAPQECNKNVLLCFLTLKVVLGKFKHVGIINEGEFILKSGAKSNIYL